MQRFINGSETSISGFLIHKVRVQFYLRGSRILAVFVQESFRYFKDLIWVPMVLSWFFIGILGSIPMVLY